MIRSLASNHSDLGLAQSKLWPARDPLHHHRRQYLAATRFSHAGLLSRQRGGLLRTRPVFRPVVTWCIDPCALSWEEVCSGKLRKEHKLSLVDNSDIDPTVA